jgi:hypothetical protein
MIAYPWREIEITFTSARDYENPYLQVDAWVEFIHDSGMQLIRPAFWDGGRTWKVRFASPLDHGTWTWTSHCFRQDCGIKGQSGTFVSQAAPQTDNRFYQHGFWHMSAGRRSLVHADGYPAILAADTAWALPWRATHEQCLVYAEDRQSKGFNAALLMSLQPDMRAIGPRDRTQDEGFDVAFEDLPGGHITHLNPEYFQYLDGLVDILVGHEIVPVWQPVFQGFGWKGLDVAGTVVPPEEYARYCRYLVARYGARPAIYLVGGDGSGYDPQVPAGGSDIEIWDAYKQPAGIHYRPHADNRAWQDASWLDFQWCQTGHFGEHIPERVVDMWRNQPVKAVANGEPSYENAGELGQASGWWQGHEAWSNLCAGGTMGVVYGAGSLWQWCLHGDEPGQTEYFRVSGAGWREALNFEGSTYVGLLAKILEGYPTTDMQPDWQISLGRRGLWVPDKLFIAYLEKGGDLWIVADEKIPKLYKVIDPRSGKILIQGRRTGCEKSIPGDGLKEPRVYICYREEEKIPGA